MTQNDVSGIGAEIFDNNVGPNVFNDGTPFNTFSTGRLRGIIYNKEIDGSPLAHEVIHQWVEFAAPSLGWEDGGLGHFNWRNDINGLNDETLDNAGEGVRRPEAPDVPADLVFNGDGTFRAVARPGAWWPTFHPMELYLAGFLPASGVPPMRLADGIIDLTNLDRITADGGVRTVTVDDVIAIEGPRTPSVATAPKQFTMGTLVFSDHAYSEAEMTFITLALRYFESDKAYDSGGTPPFQSATNGVASMQVALSGLDLGFAPPAPAAAAAALTVDAGGPLAVGESATVTVTVRDAGGAPVANVPVRWSEALVTADLNVESSATDAAGQASVLFTAADLGTYQITATVLESVGGQLGDSSVAGSATVEVGARNRTVRLLRGWNLVGWSGAASAVAGAIAPVGEILDSLFTWDASGQRFLSFNPTLPPLLNTLSTLQFGDGIWVHAAAGGGVWEQPAFTGARSISLRSGFNLVTWSGPDKMAAAAAIAGLGGALDVLFVWDEQAQRYLSYTPGAPEFLDTADALFHGEGVWIKVNRAMTWAQPAP